MPNKPTSVRRPWQVEKKPFERKEKNNSFYTSEPWRNLRRMKLNRNPLCEYCEEQGKLTKATVVDHIRRINAGGAPLAMSNLKSSCSSCHNSKSGKEAHE